QVQTYLNKIPALTGNIAVFGPAGGPFTIVYLNNLAFTDSSKLNLTTVPTGGTAPVVTTNGLTGDPNSGNKLQTLYFGSSPACTFTLSFNGLTTAPITYGSGGSALATAIQSALDAVLGANNTAVSAPDGTDDPNLITIKFQNALGHRDVSS